MTVEFSLFNMVKTAKHGSSRTVYKSCTMTISKILKKELCNHLKKR